MWVKVAGTKKIESNFMCVGGTQPKISFQKNVESKSGFKITGGWGWEWEYTHKIKGKTKDTKSACRNQGITKKRKKKV